MHGHRDRWLQKSFRGQPVVGGHAPVLRLAAGVAVALAIAGMVSRLLPPSETDTGHAHELAALMDSLQQASAYCSAMDGRPSNPPPAEEIAVKMQLQEEDR